MTLMMRDEEKRAEGREEALSFVSDVLYALRVNPEADNEQISQICRHSWRKFQR